MFVLLLYLQNFDILKAIILSFDVLENVFIFLVICSIYYSMFASLSFSFFMFRLYYAFVFGGLFRPELAYEKSDIIFLNLRIYISLYNKVIQSVINNNMKHVISCNTYN